MKKLTENIIQQRLKTCTTDLDKVQQINVTGRELKDVSLLRKMTGVEILSLSVNHISSLVDFQDCKNLRELYLRQNKISDINEIFYLKELPKLELLMLSQNPCVEDPLYRMTVIKNLKTLTELDGIAITPDERRQAQKVGAEVSLSTELIDPTDNCNSDDSQIYRTPTQSVQKLKPFGEGLNELPEYRHSSIMEKVEPTGVAGRKVVEDSNVKVSSSTQINMKRAKQQSPKTKKKNIQQTIDGSSVNTSFCKMCGNTGNESSRPIGIVPKNSNILSATLSLVKELDYPSLQVMNAEVGSRIHAFEVNFICPCQTLPNRSGNMKETMSDQSHRPPKPFI